MTTTKIEWAERVWNPVSGCDRVSPGCDNCYALAMAGRLKAMGQVKYQRDGNPATSGPGFGVSTHDDVLTAPLRWRKPARVFVNSMSDLFHDDVPDEFLAQVFAVMSRTSRHTYQVLTKRHARMCSLLSSDAFWRDVLRAEGVAPSLIDCIVPEWPLRNVWLGVSVETQRWADIRVPALLDTPAVVRWVSAEPLLGPVDLRTIPYRGDTDYDLDVLDKRYRNRGQPQTIGWGGTPFHSGLAGLGGINWVVVGGESGPGARPMHPDWARTLRDQCQAAGVPFFFKQWGEWGPAPWKLERTSGESDAAYKENSEALAATHALPRWTALHNNMIIEASHKPWSCERGSTLGPEHTPIRRWGKALAGRLLDGREWNQYPGEE